MNLRNRRFLAATFALFNLAAAIVNSTGAFAQAINPETQKPEEPVSNVDGGVGGRNGGDLCEDRIKLIRDNLLVWITVDNFRGLEFKPTEDPEQYKIKMLYAIDHAVISCTDEHLFVGSAEKTCINEDLGGGHMKITCNTKRFNNSVDELKQPDLDSRQYNLVHHEYAGLAQFEVNQGEESDYHLSDQISEKLEVVQVKRLPILPTINVYQGVVEDQKNGDLITVKCSSHDCSTLQFYLIKKGDTKTQLTLLDPIKSFSPANITAMVSSLKGPETKNGMAPLLVPAVDFGNDIDDIPGWMFNFSAAMWNNLKFVSGPAAAPAMIGGVIATVPVASFDVAMTVVVDTGMIISWPIRELIHEKRKKVANSLVILTKPDGTHVKIKHQLFKFLIKTIQKADSN